MLITETGTVFDDPTLVLTVNVDGATESVGSGSAIPAHPATQATTTARRLESTRTRFSLNTFMSIRSPYCKFKFLLSNPPFLQHLREGAWYTPCTRLVLRATRGFWVFSVITLLQVGE